MAKIFRISGYLVAKCDCFRGRELRHNLENSYDLIDRRYDTWQQLHVEESEQFEMNGEDQPNCDLALLERHFKKVIPNSYSRPIPAKGERYRHFKGKIVTVIGISRDTETLGLSVVYGADENLSTGMVWNRPLDMFMSKVDRKKFPNTRQKYRFERV